jgi:hypothetical protein
MTHCLVNHNITSTLVYIYKPSTQQISNQLITTFVSIEFINYVKITLNVSAHLETSSDDTLFKATYLLC